MGKWFLSIIVPCYNEQETIGPVLEKVASAEYGMPFEAIVVNDGSTDGSKKKIESSLKRDSRLKLIDFDCNKGKGFAITQGIKKSRGSILVIQDADLEYDPKQIRLLLKPIVEGQADAVFGSRFKGKIKGMSFANRLGNIFLTIATNTLFGSNLSDTQTCYKAVKASLAKNLQLKQNGFEIENELTARLLLKKARIEEVPINYVARQKKEGKKINWRNGINGLFLLFYYRFFE